VEHPLPNDSGIAEVAQNCAPALSNDGSLLYVGVSDGGTGFGDLLALNSTTLAPVARVALTDPNTGTAAILPDDGTASPTVGPDGDVYYGVLENPLGSNHFRGWLLHFSGDLAVARTPGAFGWDDTASIVPASIVPSYHGSSSYLLITKYNDYADEGGDGANRLALLDPGASMTDPISGATVMKEVLTIAGVTPDPQFVSSHPGAVREWCVNTAVVDPFSKSVLVNSEDGILYRWDLTTNSFTQRITLTPGIGEAYTPTLIGVDGTVYAINDATLFAIGYGRVPAPGETVWLDDALPAGAVMHSDGGDSWSWAAANPAPLSGAFDVPSSLAAGEHQLSFDQATTPLPLGASDTLFAYVYLDPANPPTEVMLQWNDGSSWEHRAYWGANSLDFGTDGTPSRQSMGALPAPGTWVRLQVPAITVGLGGRSIQGLSFTLFGGRATWDRAGVSHGVSSSSPASLDTTTLGNWRPAYGSEGYVLAADSSGVNPNPPAYATVSVTGNSTTTWGTNTGSPYALQNAGKNGDSAAAWSSATSFDVHVGLNDGRAHLVSLYALDWDHATGSSSAPRSERFDVLDAVSGSVLATQTLSSFQGEYVTFTIQGNTIIRVTNLTPPGPTSNAVVSGLFFGAGVPVPASANFVAADTTTLGGWKGVYGGDGFDIPLDASANNPSLPAYATLNITGASAYTWADPTSDPRALLKAAPGATARSVSAWYSSSSFSFDLNLTDGQSHRLALYALDWDGTGYQGGRSERIDLIDSSTSAVLDSRTIAPDALAAGEYLTWNVTGHVIIRVTNLGRTNAVINGLFLG
jgi:hypothetical protein